MSAPTWILNRTAVALHRRQLAEHGGAPGFDLVRLSMALGWAKTLAAWSVRRLSVHDLAAAYAEGVLRLRPFESGNERVAYLLAQTFLALNGAEPPPDRAEHLAVFVTFAARAIDRVQYAQWLTMRDLARRSRAATVVAVRRDAGGRVVGMGVWRAGARRSPAHRQDTAVPMLQR